MTIKLLQFIPTFVFLKNSGLDIDLFSFDLDTTSSLIKI